VHADPGSVENPIPLQHHAALAQILAEQVRCRLPGGIAGAVHTSLPADEELQLVVRDLQAQLALSAMALTNNERDASWKLDAALSSPDRNIQQLNLDLVSLDGSAQQRLASVFVHGEPAAPTTSDTLLGELNMIPDTHPCNASRCAEVSFELLDEAYLLVFSTFQADVSPLQCRTALLKKTPGVQRYRLNLADGEGQRTGLYVIAARERQPLNSLNRQLRNAPGACGTPQNRDPQRWLTATMAEIANQQHALQWRAIHFIHTPTGLEIL
jgi:hypothetical protein